MRDEQVGRIPFSRFQILIMTVGATCWNTFVTGQAVEVFAKWIGAANLNDRQWVIRLGIGFPPANVLGAFGTGKSPRPPKRPLNFLDFSISRRILTDNRKRKSPDFSGLSERLRMLPDYRLVPGPGFEPGTLGFSVRCSTD